MAHSRLQLARIVPLRLCIMPAWIFSSMGLHNYIQNNIGDTIPGFAWLDLLTQPDPYMVLPFCACAFGLFNIWTHSWMFVSSNRQRKGVRLMDFILVLFTVGFTNMLTHAPALISLHWCCALFTGLIQTLLLRHPKVKRLFGIGPLPTDTVTPFRDVFRRRMIAPISF